jgi:hypothetical protein
MSDVHRAPGRGGIRLTGEDDAYGIGIQPRDLSSKAARHAGMRISLMTISAASVLGATTLPPPSANAVFHSARYARIARRKPSSNRRSSSTGTRSVRSSLGSQWWRRRPTEGE